LYDNATGFPINYYKAKPIPSRTKYTDYDTFKGKNAAKIKNWFNFSQNSIDVTVSSSHPP
jgi:hypothetical protein